MKITVRGWGRDYGKTVVSDDDLQEIEVQGLQSSYPANRTVVEAIGSETGAVDKIIVTKKIKATMNGEYMMEIHFSKADILYLACAMFRKRSMSYFWTKFSSMEKKITDTMMERNFG